MIFIRKAEVKEVLGTTRHSTGESEITDISSVKIGVYEGDAGFYLLYFDSKGNELTDIFHNTIEGAILQAAFEFNIKEYDWEEIQINRTDGVYKKE